LIQFRQNVLTGCSSKPFRATINNLGASAENLTAAESRIRDVDMAKEMMEFTKQHPNSSGTSNVSSI